jgi:RNA ligase (TIGR02306 family)
MIKITEKSNYLAKVVKIDRLEPHPGADRLQIAIIDYQRIIVSLDTKIGDLFIYFPLESQISSEFLSFINAYSSSDLNADKEKKGFFGNKGRVKATRLRGELSEGYVHPLSSFNEFLQYKGINFNLSENNVGEEFDTIGDTLICWKYVMPVKQSHTNKPSKAAKVSDRLVDGQFRLHADTDNLKKNIHKINPDDVISITEKLHGANGVFSNILCKKKLKWHEKILKKLGVNIVDTEYDYVCSSRRVIKNIEDEKDHNHFYEYDVWTESLHNIKDKIQEGVTLYCEVVGQLKSGSWIQKDYDYGTAPNKNKVAVFRITYTNHNGQVLEFTRPQVERYCNKYDLEVVPLHFYGKAKDLYDINTDVHWHENFLSNLIRDYNEGDCYICRNKVPREGIVVQKEGEGFEAYKLKSISFLERETKLLDNEVENIEDTN